MHYSTVQLITNRTDSKPGWCLNGCMSSTHKHTYTHTDINTHIIRERGRRRAREDRDGGGNGSGNVDESVEESGGDREHGNLRSERRDEARKGVTPMSNQNNHSRKTRRSSKTVASCRGPESRDGRPGTDPWRAVREAKSGKSQKNCRRDVKKGGDSGGRRK